MTFACFFLGEYSSIILMCSLFVVLFLGGWLPLIPSIKILYMIPGWIWFSFKIVFIMFFFIWVRATLPRYRFDQLMMLGWTVILPLSFGLLFFTISLLWIYDMHLYVYLMYFVIIIWIIFLLYNYIINLNVSRV